VAACLLAVTTAPTLARAQGGGEWAKLPRMILERQYAGPLQDTLIQRWRDPVDGTTCYIYLPISAPHSAPTPPGFVQYGANTIGSISCLAQPLAVSAPAAPARRPAQPAATAPGALPPPGTTLPAAAPAIPVAPAR
jgi:hypothetical protein